MTRVGALMEPFESCEQCVGGWVSRQERLSNGTIVTTERRCYCWHMHQQKVLDALQTAQKGKKK